MSVELRLILLGLTALVGFGLWFDQFVARLEHKGADRGYTSFLVAIGNAVTIAVFTLMIGNVELGLLLLLCFVADGTPMMIGSVKRFNKQRLKRECEKRRAAEDVLNE